MIYSNQVQTVLDILKNEVDGDVEAALEKMSGDYSMTWMYQSARQLFPTSSENFAEEMRSKIYHIKGRKYDIRNITEGPNVVILEVIESYPDPESGEMYRTPQVIVLELEDGRIKTGRHYTDPALSHADLTDEQIEHGLKGATSKVIIS